MDYGKFASADELLKGYQALEKAFTQKCQQLSALEKAAQKKDESPTAVPEQAKTKDDEQKISPAITAQNQVGNGNGVNEQNMSEIDSISQISTQNKDISDDERRKAEFGWPTVEEVEELLRQVDSEVDKTSDESNADFSSSRDTDIYGGTNAQSSPPTWETGQSTTVDSAVTVPQRSADAQLSLNGLAPVATPTDEQLQQYLRNNPQVVWQLLRGSAESPTLMTGGGNVSPVLPSRPRTIKEASLMAKKLFG